MSIINTDGTKTAIGCVFGEREHMWMDGMLEVHACYYNPVENKVVEVQTGYFGIDGSNLCNMGHTIDISKENARLMLKAYVKADALMWFEKNTQKYKAEIHKGCSVRVVRGRKVAKGTTGIVFWIGEKYNQYSRENELICGIKQNPDDRTEKPIWIKAEYLEKVSVEKSPSAKSRRQFVKDYISRHYGYVLNVATEGREGTSWYGRV